MGWRKIGNEKGFTFARTWGSVRPREEVRVRRDT